MMDVAYALVMALLHSLWQSGLLLLLYKTLSQGLMRQTTPLFRRNALLSIVAIQLLITITTCSIYYTAGEAPANWTGWVNIEHHQLKAFLYPLAPWLFTVYLCWITGRLLYLGVQWVRFKKGSARGLVKPAIHLRLFTDVKAAHLGIRRKVNVWLSTAIDTPITFGWLKPVILLPVALVNQLTIPQTEALLLHELAHIRVNDYCYNWLLSLVEIIFFFNPFVRSLCHEARLEREKHCDTTVIQFNYSPLAYAESLLLAAHLQQRPVCLQPAAVSGKQQLLQRIRFFTHRNALPFTQNRLHMAMTGLLTTVVAAIVILISGPAFPVGKLGTGSGANVLMIHHPASLWLASGNTETVIATIAPPPEMRTAELSIPRIPNRPASTPMEADHADIGKRIRSVARQLLLRIHQKTWPVLLPVCA